MPTTTMDIPAPRDMAPDRSRLLRTTLSSKFAFGDRVTIDGSDITGIIGGFRWMQEDGQSVLVEWMANGQAQSAWLHPTRLVTL